MCKAPKIPEPKEPKKPQFMRNRYLDAFEGDSAAVTALRTGRSSLRIPSSTPTPDSGSSKATGGLSFAASNPANTPPVRGDFRRPPPLGIASGGRGVRRTGR